MKNQDKKKVYQILIGTVVLIIVAIIIICVSMGGTKSINESTITQAAKKYYANNSNLLPQSNYDSSMVTLSTLLSNGYINSESEGINCPSYVVVTKINSEYTYNPFIKCNNVNTTTLVNKIMSQTTTSGQGLYNLNGKYIFRGTNPNNYVKFGDVLWRIIGLDNNNNIKMIYAKSSVQYTAWDSKYNSNTDKASGINDYINNEGVSDLKSYLDSYFESFPEIFTAPRIARMAKYDVCTGKANLETSSINTCSNITRNQLISTITAEDYISSSLDTNCNTNNTKNCQNYNFLNNKGWTITAYSNDNYQAYYIDEEEGLKLQQTYISKAARPVIALRNDITCISGTGSELDPYIVK